MGQKLLYASISPAEEKEKVCVRVRESTYPVGEDEGGDSFLPPIHLHLHLAPLGFSAGRTDLAHNTGEDNRKKHMRNY